MPRLVIVKRRTTTIEQQRVPVLTFQRKVRVAPGGALAAARQAPNGTLEALEWLGVRLPEGGLFEIHMTIVDLAAVAGGSPVKRN